MKENQASNKHANATPDLLDILLDKENCEPIPLQDENGKIINFEQVAIIPYNIERQDRILYVVLKPLDKIEGIEEDEAVVFKVDTDKYGNTVLKLEEEEGRAIEVFEKYYDLLEEVAEEKKKKSKKK